MLQLCSCDIDLFIVFIIIASFLIPHSAKDRKIIVYTCWAWISRSILFLMYTRKVFPKVESNLKLKLGNQNLQSNKLKFHRFLLNCLKKLCWKFNHFSIICDVFRHLHSNQCNISVKRFCYETLEILNEISFWLVTSFITQRRSLTHSKIQEFHNEIASMNIHFDEPCYFIAFLFHIHYSLA